ncbi:DUF6049 family protein [Microbacterium murale]|uniref:2-oxoglutarate dehydrogenase n=1 Tax=Microbacterium murale TaxID=1081040 RepID=A0ABQ1RHW1_9MICO|nr:DUF6049 family protein [Microbacterium murale]GGD67612.1 hypothetical protein GCM10007269_08400 [Microbacterium murale]
MISPRFSRRARAQRRARGAVVFALAAALILAPQLTAMTPAVADEDAPDEGIVELSLSAGVHGVAQPGSALLTTVTIDNGTQEQLAAGQVTVELSRTPLADGAALTAWLDSGDAPGAFASLGTEESEAVAASETSALSVATPVGVLGTLPAGVYPIRASLTADSDAPAAPSTAQSVLVIHADADAAAQVAVLVPITATPADGGLLTAEELTTLTAPDGALTAQLDGVAGTSAALAVDPLIPAAIRALGTAAPASALDWLTRLEALPNDRFALQAGDADATTQSRADLPGLLAPLPLSSYLDPENFSTEATPTPTPTAPTTPTPSPTPSEPELPTDSELMSIERATPAVLWPTAGVDTADLATFSEWMATDATTILPSTAIAASIGAAADIDGNRVLVTDAAASAALSDAAAETDDSAREHDIAAGIAHLALTGPAASMLVGLERNETRTAEALRETILAVSSIADPTGFDALRTGSPQSATLRVSETDASASADRGALLNTLLADESRLTAFATILEDPLVLLSPERLQMLRVLGVRDAAAYTDAVSAHRIATTTTLDSVGVQEPSAIQLFTSAAPLPVWVRNDLPWPVTVQLTATPSDARLDVQPSTPVEALPASNTRVKVPVEARVGSGSLSVDFALSSPTGVRIGTDQTAMVTVRAEWESIGLVILGGVIALLLALGIVRTVVRRRKDRVDAEDEADDGNRAPASGE